jgi:SSS family solute:Na+ symporter
LSPLDYVVIAVYLLGTLGLGLWIGRRIRSGADFFLAGRSLPWWAIGMSLVATDIGGTDIIGVGGAAYRHGLAVANFEWIGCVPAMIVAAFVFVPFFYRTGVYTVPEFMERRYNAGVRTALAFCWLIFMACNLGVMLLASAKMMTQIVGWDLWVCIAITAGLVGVYTVSGGLAAVVYTDVLQCIVMIAGCLLVLVIGLADVGGIDGLRDALDARAQSAETDAADADMVHPPDSHQLDLIVPVDAPSPYPWPAIYFGLALVLSPAYWIGNQAIIQRSLGASSEYAAKASYVWGAVLKNVIPLIIAVPGLIAAVKFPDLEEGDAAFPRLVSVLLPSGLRGVFVAGFLAALMSSIDSYLNSASTIVCNDLYKRFLRPDADESQLLRMGRLTTVALITWAVVFAFVLMRMDDGSGIYAIFQTLMAFFQGPALAVLLLGVFWRRATGRAALIAFLCGIGTTAVLYTLSRPTVIEALGWRPLFQIPDPFLYFSVWAFLVTAAVLVLLSLITPPEPAEKLQYVLTRRRRGAGA